MIPTSLILCLVGAATARSIGRAATIRGPTSRDESSGLQVAIASYINPSDTNAWTRLEGYDSKKVSVLVANPLNGPNYVKDQSYADVIKKSTASGKKVLGYVRTGYLGKSNPPYRTRLGSFDLADWTSQIEHDVDLWYTLYGNTIGGIFFDEGWNECGTRSNSNDTTYSDLYSYINDYTKRKYPGAMTVLNPGYKMPQCFEDTMDTLMTFESDYGNYTKAYPGLEWVPKDTRKIWHIIYNVDQSNIDQVVSLARQRHAGFIQITNRNGSNPYDVLPDEPYMQNIIRDVDSGSPLIEEPSPLPSGPKAATPDSLKVTSSDYSSVSLSWSEANDALGYHVYQDGKQILDLPNTMTHVTVGMLESGASNLHFTVRAVGGSGVESPDSNVATASTLPLPGGVALANATASTSGGQTTYTVDSLVPHGVFHLFIWTGQNQACLDATKYQAWPVYYNTGMFVCATHMVENGQMYKYHYDKAGPGQNIPWSWQPLGKINFETNGYTYTYKWTLPTADIPYSSNAVFTAAGYAADASVFKPCPGTVGGSGVGCNN